MRLLVAILIVLLLPLPMPGCASTVPGQAPPASVAALAASAGLVAYREALTNGASRDAALRAAQDAAIASALAMVPGSVDAEYRPWVTLALEALILTVRAKGPEALPPDAKVEGAIRDAITDAEAAR